MPLITWDPAKYSVHVDTIDDQHHVLIDLINQLHDAMRVAKSREMVPSTLDALLKYTREHFSYEEVHMRDIRYPDYQGHKEEHEEFVAKVDQFIKDYHAGRAGLSFTIINFLRDWLLHHIMESDKKYSDFVKS